MTVGRLLLVTVVSTPGAVELPGTGVGAGHAPAFHSQLPASGKRSSSPDPSPGPMRRRRLNPKTEKIASVFTDR